MLLEEGTDRGQPVVITEFGGLSFTPDEGQDWFGYSTVASAEELVAKLAELVDALVDSPMIAGFCYTQLTDTEQETNGLLTIDREPKLDPERVRAVNSRASRAVPSEMLDALIKQEVERRRRARGQE